jgi:hypothetical protein
VKDLAGQHTGGLPRGAAAALPLTTGRSTPRKGRVGMYLAGRWYSLDLGARRRPTSRARASLDVALLQRHVLERPAAIGDVRSDKRIDFVGGARGTTGARAGGGLGAAAVAFSMFPVTVDDLMAISDSRRDHAAEVHVVRAQAAGRAPGPHDSEAPTHEGPGCGQVREERARRPEAAGCEVIFEPDLKDDTLADAIRTSGAEVLVVRSTKVTDGDAGCRAALAHRPGRRRLQHH